MQRVFRVVDTRDLEPVGLKTTKGFNASIRAHGVITPILLAEVPDADGVISLKIVDGNRRVRAAHAVGLAKVPAVVLRETTAADRARLTLICNHLRSLNFYTESLAATALAEDADGIEREAKAMGISASKVLGMVRKLEQMPPVVRTAMYEGRLQVSSATDIAGFPRSLQDEVVARLEQRGWLDTRTVIAMKEDWEARNGPINPRTAKRQQQAPSVPAPPDDWSDPEPVAFDDIAPPERVGGWQVRPVEASRHQVPGPTLPEPGVTATVAQPATTEVPQAPHEPGVGRHKIGTTPAGGSLQPEPATDTYIGEMEAFVKVLDATLRELAREGHALGISRSVWIDRTMRAWSLAEAPRGTQATVGVGD